jgi:two-component system CitB family response regulator/two-component system response regulator DcuR
MITRVLIVEDDVRIADLHRRFTERVPGCEVVGVAHRLEDAREIRARELEIDVILITAAREVGPLKEALRGGVFDYLIKPVTAERFHDCLIKFCAYRERLKQGSAIGQQDVDSLLRPNASRMTVGNDCLPKGIDGLTLAKVRGVFEERADTAGRSAEDVGELIGISRSTARRYLEYLIAEGMLYAEAVYGSVGRPERRYFRC